jgi:hypothetical protein
VQGYLAQMGQPAFEWPTPDGPPDRSEYWISNLMPRWRFALDLVQGRIEGTSLDLEALGQVAGSDGPGGLAERMLGAPLSPEVIAALDSALGPVDEPTRLQLWLAGLLASPGFQWQ